MLFNSIEFLLFFPCVVLIYFILPHKLGRLSPRRDFLLIASCFFYMSFIPKYMLILIFTTVVDYTGARLIEKWRERPKAKTAVFVIGLACNVGLLVYFKYLGVIGDTINFFGHMISLKTIVFPEVVLPIGISFHTFQSMGYFIDTYRGKEKAEKNFLDFALFLMFFPQLVAGPIERSSNLIPQLKAKHTLKAENISAGGRKMLWGMFKKVVVADNLALFADAVFDAPDKYAGLGVLIGVLCFTVQIYCDFSGYSDIAVGCAKILDIDLMKNFDTPYFSRSVPEFWRRWHISLSTWFRDYVYIPLGGNRVKKPRWMFNQLVTFTVSGVWHGAGYTYVIWGFLNGVYICLSRLLKPIRDKVSEALRLEKIPFLPNLFRTAVTFTMISFSWIFFRANTVSDSFLLCGRLFSSTAMDFSAIPVLRVWVALGAAALLFAAELIHNFGKPITAFAVRMPHLVRIVCYALLVSSIILFGAYDNKAFIYFQF
ncbi:MAG: MBOAT family protein [Clostridia bacterium]|nr:MBOAT family protein [Clostridia bacterium]